MARVEALYYVPENKKSPHRAVVTWFCRPAFLPQTLDNSHGMEEDGVAPLDNNNEVIAEAREFGTEIDAESIYLKCSVIQGEVTKIPEKFAKQHKQGPMPCYLMRFQLKHLRRHKFSLEPLKTLDVKKGKAAAVVSDTSPSKKVTPLKVNLANLRISKRKLSESETANVASPVKKSKVSKSASNSKETSPELSSFVTSNVNVANIDNIDGEPDKKEVRRSRRTSKPVEVVEEKPKEELGKRRHKSMSSVGRVLESERFTQVETATGSGRKITIKCGDKSKLRSKDIINLLSIHILYFRKSSKREIFSSQLC